MAEPQQQEHLRAEYRRKFQEYDKNGDGLITRQEAQEVLEKSLGFTEEKARILILRCDINQDGKLSYEDFVGFYIKVQEKKKAIRDNFQEFDKDGKGYVSADDAKRILSELMFTDQEVTSLLETHDTNKDGKLQYQEFVHFWGA